MIKPYLWATDLIISFSSEMLKNFNEASGFLYLYLKISKPWFNLSNYGKFPQKHSFFAKS